MIQTAEESSRSEALGHAHALLGKLTDAIVHLRKVLQHKPALSGTDSEVRLTLSTISDHHFDLHVALTRADIHASDILETRLSVLDQLQAAFESSYEPSRLELIAALDLATEVIFETRSLVRASAAAHLDALRQRDKTSPVARKASTIVNLTMHVLPARHRSRYGEEILSELHELAKAKATGSMQIYYALRQLSRIWALRRTLANPAAHPLEPLIRATCWALSSEIRTWLVIGTVTLSALIDVVMEQGWGSALLAVPTAWVFHRGACWLRTKLDITVISGNQEDDEEFPPTG
ncbi:hypothetical protein [Nonomuraea rubra]|uniref:Uncharacterized protein n=1 Tax=Nonomuraea rubra TaxID=46180 RepID=A0A7X0P8N9_9ACTN|nr:hypothetical protein [Nonomuraea rubra]MBB6557276.1 hypothetical protein [Nonomuraea rubra]